MNKILQIDLVTYKYLTKSIQISLSMLENCQEKKYIFSDHFMKLYFLNKV